MILFSMAEFWNDHQEVILQYLQATGFLAISLFAGIILDRILLGSMKRYSKKYERVRADSFARNLGGSLGWFIPLLLALLTLPLHGWGEGIAEWLGRIIETILYLFGARILIQITEIVGDVLRKQYDIVGDDNLSERKIVTQLQFIKRLVAVVVMTLAGAFILLQFDSVREIGTGLLTSAGVAGVIIGFAAQKSIANLLAGFQIAFTQPIRIDDAVIVEGEWGRIEEITLTYVVIRIWDKRRLIVPLNYFLEHPFQNWTRNSADLVGVVMLHVDYNLPVDAIRSKLTELLTDHPLWDNLIQKVQVTEAKGDTVEIRLLMGARTAPNAFDLRCDVREGMINFIRETYPESLPRTRVEMQPLPMVEGVQETHSQ
jgi:small-conductance mechanosensitive channel